MVVSIRNRYIMWRLKRRGITTRCLEQTCGLEIRTMTRGRAMMWARIHHWDSGHGVEVRFK